MSVPRPTGSECPIPGNGEVGMDLCAPPALAACPYYRGAALVGPRMEDGRHPWRVTCNWPRNGSELWQAPGPLDDLPASVIAQIALDARGS